MINGFLCSFLESMFPIRLLSATQMPMQPSPLSNLPFRPRFHGRRRRRRHHFLSFYHRCGGGCYGDHGGVIGIVTDEYYIA